MIVDCHTRVWANTEQLGNGAPTYLRRQGRRKGVSAGTDEHLAAAECVDKSLVMGFRSVSLGADVPNDFLADYVSSHGDKMVGIAAVDPTEPDAVDEAAKLLDGGVFQGLTISPSSQNFHPSDSRAVRLYEWAERRDVPLFIHQGTHFPMQGRMEYARPMLLDEVAREYPKLTMVISCLGHPWVAEGISLVGKHPRVFADVAGLLRRPWQAYNAMVLAHQFNVIDKLLFGSDFPYATAAQAIETVYRLHEVTQGTNLPGVPRELLRSVVERDAMNVLGIAQPSIRSAK
ncbi:MAG: amidohydrolase family protein [Planctomycetota bacterium]|nr:amidohydrolase family protein [Planctomycetota bacterium]